MKLSAIEHRIGERWKLVKLPSTRDACQFAVEHFVHTANLAIQERGQFSVALSGGSTPVEIYRELALDATAERVDWTRVLLFWSDERCVPMDHEESNFRMAMDAGLAKLPVREENIFRMQAETDLEVHAAAYEHLIRAKAGGAFDLMMLGMGPDGHTASLFPDTEALHEAKALVTGNYVPQKKSSRMTCTFPCINASRQICLYVLGAAKKPMLCDVLLGPPNKYPVQRVGTAQNPAIWITDVDVPC